jgi:ComF family protein
LFEGSLRQAIHAFKYSGQSSLAEPLGELLVSYWAESPLPVDSLVPVPLHPTRQRQRGYNQSSLLATRLAAAAHLPLVEGCLVRVRATASQMTLGVPERQRNVEGAFRCVDSRLAGQRVLLVDDVCTSACTLGACSTALCESGVASVWALTLARAV